MLTKYIGKKELFKAFIWFCGSVGLVFAISQQVRFLISETDSISQHYFLQIVPIKPAINNYTVVWSDWYHGKVIKKIIGVEGDRIWYDQNNQMFVNDFKIGVPRRVTSDGRRLHATPTQTIPKEYMFLYSEHIQSFDSRYQELGLVPLSKLQGLVVPLV